MAYGIKCPCILDDEDGNPLRFIVDDKHCSAENSGNGVDDKECNVEGLLMTGDFFIIGNIQKQIFYKHIF